MSTRLATQTTPQTAERYSPISAENSPTDLVLRRFLDITVSGLALLLLLPFLVLLALIVSIDSSGPVLFTQRRVGKDGKEFAFFKFRSMYSDAEKRLDTVLDTNERTGPVFKMRHDPRITRVGQWLRHSSMDEIPQLLNILRGEMSLVGPRPALPREVALYTPMHRHRLCVTPGLTGLWQVSGRADLSFDESIALDLEYIARRSFALNCVILLRTVPAVLTGRGAY